jgi:hypothetical protein
MVAPSMGTKKLVPYQKETVDALEAIPPWRMERIYTTRFVPMPLKAMLSKHSSPTGFYPVNNIRRQNAN